MKNYRISTDADTKATLVQFDTFADYVAATQAENPRDPELKHRKADDWTLYTTFAQASKMITSGYREGADRIRAVAERVQQAIPESLLQQVKPQQIWDVTGEQLDVGRFLDGEPECFMDEFIPERGERLDGNGIIRITANLTASCGVNAKELERRGVYAVALADVLESLGYRVEITGVICSECNHIDATGRRKNGTHVLLFPVKASDQPLEIDRLAFTLAHPASFRTLGFNVMDVVGYRDSGRGRPHDLPQKFRGDINVGKLAWRSEDDVDTANAIISQLKDLGIDLGAEALAL